MNQADSPDLYDVAEEMASVLREAASLANRTHNYGLLQRCTRAFRAYDVLVAKARIRPKVKP